MAGGALSRQGGARHVDREADARWQGLRLELRHAHARHRASGGAASQPVPDRLSPVGARDGKAAAAQYPSLPAARSRRGRAAAHAGSLSIKRFCPAQRRLGRPPVDGNQRERAAFLLCSRQSLLPRPCSRRDSGLALAKGVNATAAVSCADLLARPADRASPIEVQVMPQVCAAAQPNTIGRYTLLERIGTGGQGEVWRAHDESRGVDIALKVLAPTAARNPVAWEALEREHAIASRLQHPGILQVLAPERIDDLVVLPMELAAGGDLRRLRGAGYLRIVPILLEAAEALEYAHARGVIHRDLKPGHVLLDSRGRVKIADFGIAGLLPAASAGAVDSRGAGHSPFSASPEQLRGEPPSAADDIYGLGALAYELLSGHPPYYPNFDLRRALTQPVPELVPARQLPPELGELVMRMLAKRPADRPTSMQHVMDELDSTLNATLSFAPEGVQSGEADQFAADEPERVMPERQAPAEAERQLAQQRRAQYQALGAEQERRAEQARREQEERGVSARRQPSEATPPPAQASAFVQVPSHAESPHAQASPHAAASASTPAHGLTHVQELAREQGLMPALASAHAGPRQTHVERSAPLIESPSPVHET